MSILEALRDCQADKFMCKYSGKDQTYVQFKNSEEPFASPCMGLTVSPKTLLQIILTIALVAVLTVTIINLKLRHKKHF